MGELDPVSFSERSARAIADFIRNEGTVRQTGSELGNSKIKWVPRQVLLVKITAELEDGGDLTGYYQWQPLHGTITEDDASATGQVNLDEVENLPDYAEGKSPPYSAVHWQGLTGMAATDTGAESQYAIGIFGSLIEDNPGGNVGSTGPEDKGQPHNILYFIPMGREKFWARIDNSEETSPSSGIWKYEFTEGYVREGAFTAAGDRVSDGSSGPHAYNTAEIGNMFPAPVGDGTIVEITQQFKSGGTALDAYYNFSLCCDGGSTGGGGGFGP